MWRNWNPRAMLVRMYIHIKTMGSNMDVSQRIKNRTFIISRNHTLSIYLKEHLRIIS